MIGLTRFLRAVRVLQWVSDLERSPVILTVTLNAAIDKTHLIPGFAADRVNRPVQVIALAGGKGINVSRVLKTLGADTLATGLVAGHAGAFILSSLEAEGIPHDFHRLSAGESRTGTAPHASASAVTDATASSSAFAAGVMAHGRPSNSVAEAPSGPDRSLPAIGWPPT